MTETKTASKHREAKRKAKDSVFADLFSDSKYLLALYKVLHPEDTSVTEDMLNDVTIENVMVNDQYNDLGFTVRSKRLILLEAQSTYTENIIIRILLYLAETWKRYIIETGQNNYSTKKLVLPQPEFYVVFSGIKKADDRQKYPENLGLKDCFFPNTDCAIDMSVKMLYGDPYPQGKINGKDGDIIWEYVTFCKVFDKVIYKEKRGKEGLQVVIDTCKEMNALSEYLSERKKEVVDIMSLVFSQEEALEMYIRSEKRELAEEIARNSAIKMLKNGKLSTEEISEYSGLTIEEVEALEKGILEEA